MGGDLHRVDGLPGQHVPMDGAPAADGLAANLLHRPGIDDHLHHVAVEQGPEVGQIADAALGIVMPVVGHQKRVHPVHLLDSVDDEVGVLGAGDRDDAVVVEPRLATVGLENFLQAQAAFGPVQTVFLLVDPAAAADPLIVKGQVQRMASRIEATGAVAHQIPSSGR